MTYAGRCVQKPISRGLCLARLFADRRELLELHLQVFIHHLQFLEGRGDLRQGRHGERGALPGALFRLSLKFGQTSKCDGGVQCQSMNGFRRLSRGLGLKLSVAQAARLFGLRPQTCEVVRVDLAQDGALRRCS
jgi:hypothetical protein